MTSLIGLIVATDGSGVSEDIVKCNRKTDMGESGRDKSPFDLNVKWRRKNQLNVGFRG
jgi:hypothetical protein